MILVFAMESTKVKRSFVCMVILLLLTIPMFAQKKEKWIRIHTFEDAVIEMNATNITFGLYNIGHVRFRWVYDKPEKIPSKPDVKFKSRIEIIEFKCEEKLYRLYEITYFDADNKLVHKIEGSPSAEWIELKRKGIMEKLFYPACSVIEEKRKNPWQLFGVRAQAVYFPNEYTACARTPNNEAYNENPS